MKPKIIIIDDDLSLANTLASSFVKRNYHAFMAADIELALEIAKKEMPQFAVVDLRLNASNGLQCTKELLEIVPNMKIVILTGYASINTAVEAIKLGACHYLAKPASTNDIINAFNKTEADTEIPLTQRHSSIKNLEWETIQQTLVDTNYNITETARRLGMHRRTLARKLKKQPVK